jgi:hypothetical protein
MPDPPPAVLDAIKPRNPPPLTPENLVFATRLAALVNASWVVADVAYHTLGIFTLLQSALAGGLLTASWFWKRIVDAKKAEGGRREADGDASRP